MDRNPGDDQHIAEMLNRANGPLHVSPELSAAIARNEAQVFALVDDLLPRSPMTDARDRFAGDTLTTDILSRVPEAARPIVLQLVKLAFVDGFNNGMEHANSIHMRGIARVMADINGRPLT